MGAVTLSASLALLTSTATEHVTKDGVAKDVAKGTEHIVDVVEFLKAGRALYTLMSESVVARALVCV